MGQELQKQTSAALTFEIRPAVFVTQLSELLVTIQEAYRSKLSEMEQQLWMSTLSHAEEKFSMPEIYAAMTHMIKNPPLFQVDGPEGPVTQKWRGMPKLPDLIETMLDLREQRSRAAVKAQEETREQEFKKLQKERDEHPERFMTFAEVIAKVKQERPELLAGSAPDKHGVEVPLAMPALEKISPVLMSDEAAARRIRQMKADFANHEKEKQAK